MVDTQLPFEKIERKVLFRHPDATTDDKFGCYPDKRTIQQLLQYGIVNVNKSAGPTSHQISDYVKKIFKSEKTGHSGTLDPNVTGCLPVAISKATRVVSALLIAGKEYVCIMHVHEEKSEQEIREAIAQFIGKINQLPPVKCAVKRQWRVREVYYIDIIEIDGQDVLFRVGCEAGTYIRKLCTDIGKLMNCGAHMAELVRTKAGPFHIDNSFVLTDLIDALAYYNENGDESYLRQCVLPYEVAVSHIPKIYVLDTTVDSICHGAPLNIPGIAKLETGIEKDSMVAVMTLKGELIGLGDAQMNSEDMHTKPRGCAVTHVKVFISEGMYPKFVKEEKEESDDTDETKKEIKE